MQLQCSARRGREAGPKEDVDDASTSGVEDIDHTSNGAIALDGSSMAQVEHVACTGSELPSKISQYVKHAHKPIQRQILPSCSDKPSYMCRSTT